MSNNKYKVLIVEDEANIFWLETEKIELEDAEDEQ